MCYENAYPSPNFNGAAAAVWEWISNYVLTFDIWLLIDAGLLRVSNLRKESLTLQASVLWLLKTIVTDALFCQYGTVCKTDLDVIH